MNIQRQIFSIILLAVALSVNAQVAEWLIRSQYDSITIAEGHDMIITDSLGIKTLWSFNGQRLSTRSTQDYINPFQNGYAVVTDRRDKNHITGFYSTSGSFTSLDYMVANSSAKFSDGYLLVKNPEDNYYRFIGTNGMAAAPLLVSARPFNRGYASCETYENLQKEKDLYPLMLSASTMQEVSFRLDNEVLKRGDINFISSVNDEGKGIVVYKERVYLFDAATAKLSPIYASSTGPSEKKDKPVKIANKQQVVDFVGGESVIKAASDKTRAITIKLDEMNAPTSIQYVDKMVTFSPVVVPPRQLKSPLNKQRDDYPSKIYSLYWGDSLLVLPSQLEDVGQCFNDKAMIQLNGKWGLIKVHPNDGFSVILNDGKEMPFRHKTLQAPIKLYMPAYVPIKEAKLLMVENSDTVPSLGCRIDYNSAKITPSRDQQDQGHIDYMCEMDFPSYLPDEISEDKELNAIDYNAQIQYNGLISPVLPIRAYGWQYKYITLKTEDESIDAYGNFTCKLNLEKDIKSANEIEYPLKISIQSDTLMNSYTKQSEVLYTILVYGLQEGRNTFEVTVKEGDEPTIDTSSEIEVYYEKPARPSKDKQPIKPKVVVKAKHNPRPRIQRPVSTPVPAPEKKKDYGSGFGS